MSCVLNRSIRLTDVEHNVYTTRAYTWHVLELSIACTRVQVDLNLSAEFCDLSASLSELETSAWEAWTGNRCQMAVKGEPGFACQPIDANM